MRNLRSLGSHPPISERPRLDSASALPKFRVDHDLDFGWLDAPPALVDQRNSKSLTVRGRTEHVRRLAISDPFVAPFGHRDEWQAERSAHLGQRIFDAGAVTFLAIFAFRHDSAFDQTRQSMRENAARDVEICLEIVEAPNTIKRGAEDEQRPSIANQLEAAGEIAMARGDQRAADDWRGCHGRQTIWVAIVDLVEYDLSP